jgi:hypothetical protein
MTMRGTTQTQLTKPATTPVNLDTGKPEIFDLIKIGLSGASCILASALGLWVAAAFGSHTPFEAIFSFAQPGTEFIGWWRVIGWFAGWALGVTFWLFGYGFYSTFADMVAEYRAWRMRVDQWNDAALAAYNAQGGVETEQTYTEWEMQADNLQHVLLTAIGLHNRIQSGKTFSINGLYNDGLILWGDHQRKFGTFATAHQARLMLDRLAELKVIEGRSESVAGRWLPETLDETIETIERNWK